MSYDTKLAERVRAALRDRPGVVEKRMFGGLAFMLDGKMLCGVVEDDLMVRVGPDRYEEALRRPNVRRMDFTGRPMRGYVFIAPAGTKTSRSIEMWVEQGVQFVSTLRSAEAGRNRRRNRAR